MILRQMPDLTDDAFRNWFYTRWGRENVVILADACRAEYPPYTQTMSVKMAQHGREEYQIDRRRVAVDDDNYLVLNEGRTYSSVIDSPRPVESYSVFFRPGLLDEVWATLSRHGSDLPDDTTPGVRSMLLDERLARHDRIVTPVMRYIRKVVAAGEASDEWLEEQCQFLAARLLRANGLALRQADRLTSAKRSTRRELHRRVMLARELIDSQYQQALSLPELAAASHLSSHHLLRAFKQILGLTPHAYLRAKRAAVAARLLADTDLQVQEIATRVGFESRSALFRAVRDHFRTSPKALRKAGLPID